MDRYTDEYVETKMQESFARSRALLADYKANRAIIKARIKGEIRKAQARNKAIKEELWREEYIVRENLLRRGVW